MGLDINQKSGLYYDNPNMFLNTDKQFQTALLNLDAAIDFVE